MRVKLLENDKTVCESGLMYAIVIWVLTKDGRRLMQSKGLCTKILGVLQFAVHGVGELELGRDNRRGKVLCWLCHGSGNLLRASHHGGLG